VLDSDRTVGLLPAFFVVAAGPLAMSREEAQIARRAKRAGISGTLASDLAPARTELEPSLLAGSFSGSVNQVDPEVRRLNRERQMTFTFDAEGGEGTAVYGRPTCESNLTLTGSSGAALAYQEGVGSGRCGDGGTWFVKLEDGQLLATWWRSEGTTFRLGRLDR
jgi:hypothetical protein